MINNLLILFSIIIIFYLIRGNLNHEKLFSLGLLYYFILPIFVGENKNIFNIEYFEYWFKIYGEVNFSQKLFLLIYSGLIFISYYSGALFVKKISSKNYSNSFIKSDVITNGKLGRISSLLITLALLAVSSIIWNESYKYFFHGYSIGYNPSLMGKMATLNILLTVFFFLSKSKLFFFTSIITLSLIIINSILLLSMGGRMYVLLIAIFFLVWFFDNKKLSKKIIVIFIFISLLLIIIGVIRSHEFSLNLLSYIALAEPVFTSFSLFSFLSNESNFHYLNIPYNFLNSFFLIFPDYDNYKENLIIDIRDMGFDFISPLGATSLFVSLLANFGTIGGLFFIFFFSAIIEKSKQSLDIRIRIFYTTACSIIPFMLFRDGFGIILKVLFFTGLIIPFALSFLSTVLKTLKNKG
ncbi:hypothetical protein [Xenorhabdus bovienii]|uniref:hypothetical protein n=1 Tax=Xenorhabdus bovienii TaxID=40576 RepID=UPI0023B341A7|nr:hypothetical protein [Xenorhabdus bovienii]MDE9544017.1 hypothetical protein [Xenorhabdus bovienii]